MRKAVAQHPPQLPALILFACISPQLKQCCKVYSPHRLLWQQSTLACTVSEGRWKAKPWLFFVVCLSAFLLLCFFVVFVPWRMPRPGLLCLCLCGCVSCLQFIALHYSYVYAYVYVCMHVSDVMCLMNINDMNFVRFVVNDTPPTQLPQSWRQRYWLSRQLCALAFSCCKVQATTAKFNSTKEVVENI